MRISSVGLDLIKSFEGLRLEAYADAVGVWTIGYGTTRGVTAGMTISREDAEELLREDAGWFEQAVLRLLPIELTQGEFDALVSFTYNLGAGALEESTLRKRLLAGEPRCWVYQKEMPRWNKAGGRVLAGLVRRRQAEADLACLGYLSDALETPEEALEEPVAKFPLDVPYFWQRNSKTGHGERMCFSSAMAMALDYLDPEAIEGDDDWYLGHVFNFGDSVSADAQIKAATSLGFDAKFRMDGTEQDLLDLLDAGVPVPIGILHKGLVDSPTGGGHWITLIGYDERYFHVHDPFGELNVVRGGYNLDNGPVAGKNKRYTRENLMKRWLIDGSGADGWLVDLR